MITSDLQRLLEQTQHYPPVFGQLFFYIFRNKAVMYTFNRPFATHHEPSAPSRPGSYQPATRDHLSTWFSHEMKPRDPYGGQDQSRSKSMPPITRVSAVPPKVTGAGLSESNTGCEWAGSLYKPSNGDTRRAHRKKGYFNNPDKEVARLPPKGEPPMRNNKKAHSLGLTDADMPVRAEFGNQGAVLAKCLRASDYGAKKFFVKTTDDTWAPKEAPPSQDLRHAELFQKEAVDFITMAAKTRESDRLKRKEQRRMDKRAVEVYDPWSHPAKGNPNHTKLSLEAAQQKFDEKVSKSTWVGKSLGKYGSGAPTIDRGTGKLKTGMSYDAETHLRNAYKTTQNSGDAVMTYSRRDHYGENRHHGDDVKAQAAEQKQLRRSQRENSMMARVNEKGFASGLGHHAGSGAPNRTKSGKINCVLTTGLGGGGPANKDPNLGKMHKQQMAESEFSRKYDKNPAHYDTFEKFDPFEKSKVKRDAGGYIKGGKQHTKKGVGLVAPDVIVEGATIANVMGTPGGGAQNEFGGSTRLVACMDHEEYDVETDAQKAGKSQWNKPGGGGPVRKADGTINTKTRGKAEMDKSGVTEMKADPNYHSRLAQIRSQQEEFLKLKQADRKAERKTEKDLIAKKAKEEFLQTGTNPHHRGPAIPDRFVKPKKDLYGRVKPPVNQGHAKIFEQQIKEKEAEKKEITRAAQSADRKHLAVVSEWQGNGGGHPRKGADGQVTGHYLKDMSIHPDIDISDVGVYSKETRTRKANYHKALSKTKDEKKANKRANKSRRDQDEAEHNRNQNKFLNRPGAGAPQRDAEGKAKTRRGGPPGDTEYKMMAVAAANLN